MKIIYADTFFKRFKGLMGKKVGEIAEVQVPAGIMKFEVLEISL